MAALSLGSPLAGGMVYRGPMFVPASGAAGSTPVAQAPTIATRAYGITAGPPSGGPRTAHWGVVGAATVATGLLVLLWYSLPR